MLPTPEPERAPGVLVVDDDPAICRLLEGVLRDAGFQVWSAGTVADARTLYQQHRGWLAVLLLDVHLGDATGPGLLAELRREGPTPPVVFMTGSGTQPGGENVLAIPKPFALPELLAALRQSAGLARLDS